MALSPQHSNLFTFGERVVHPEFGQGVIVEAPKEDYLRVFFTTGERLVPIAAVHREQTRTQRILGNVAGSADRARNAWLARLLEAPRWDLVVFDEVHHLTAYRNGNKVTKTANYKG